MRHAGSIDVVYTWVDGSDPEFQASLQHHRSLQVRSDDPWVIGDRRFRESDELRYWLRSLELYAPGLDGYF